MERDGGWPVQVYRSKMMISNNEEGEDDDTNDDDGGCVWGTGWEEMIVQNKNQQRIRVRAIPREACIVIPRLQVRIRLSIDGTAATAAVLGDEATRAKPTNENQTKNNDHRQGNHKGNNNQSKPTTGSKTTAAAGMTEQRGGKPTIGKKTATTSGNISYRRQSTNQGEDGGGEISKKDDGLEKRKQTSFLTSPTTQPLSKAQKLTTGTTATTTATTRRRQKMQHDLVIRRHDRLWIYSAERLRTYVFRFESIQDCANFCDRLVLLNPIAFPPTRTSNGVTRTTQVKPLKPPPPPPPPALGTRYNFFSHLRPSHNQVSEGQQDDGNGSGNNEITTSMLQTLAQLLQDPDFAQLVSNLESGLLARKDGRQLLDALAKPDGGLLLTEGEEVEEGMVKKTAAVDPTSSLVVNLFNPPLEQKQQEQQQNSSSRAQLKQALQE